LHCAEERAHTDREVSSANRLKTADLRKSQAVAFHHPASLAEVEQEAASLLAALSSFF
jgi:hypothetical protein